METETKSINAERTFSRKLGEGAVAGVVGGIVFGVMMQFMMPKAIGGAIPALYGMSGVGAGWVIHLFNSAVFGAIFSAILSINVFEEYTDSVGKVTGMGVVYGFLVWLGAAAILMPIWLSTVTGMNPPLPNIVPKSIVGHLMFGIVLGIVYGLLRNR